MGLDDDSDFCPDIVHASAGQGIGTHDNDRLTERCPPAGAATKEHLGSASYILTISGIDASIGGFLSEMLSSSLMELPDYRPEDGPAVLRISDAGSDQMTIELQSSAL